MGQLIELTVDVKTAGRLNTSQSVHHLTAVSARVIRLRVLDGQCRFVVPEEHLVLAACINFACVFEPSPIIYRTIYTVSRNVHQHENNDISEMREYICTKICSFVSKTTVQKCAALRCIYLTCAELGRGERALYKFP